MQGKQVKVSKQYCRSDQEQQPAKGTDPKAQVWTEFIQAPYVRDHAIPASSPSSHLSFYRLEHTSILIL